MKNLVCGLIVVLAATVSAGSVYYTGFELAEGWAMGSLGVDTYLQPPGGTWTNNAIAQVQDYESYSGDNAVYFNSASGGNHIAYFTPAAAYTGSSVTLSYQVYLPAYSMDVANEYHLFRLITDAATFNFRFENFGTDGDPDRHRTYMQSGLGAGGQNGAMNRTWAAGEWTRFEFTLDFDNNTYSYLIDSPTRGINALSDLALGRNVTQLSAVELHHRDIQGNNLTMYIDDFAVIPEPATLALLGFGLAGVVFKRK